MFKLVQYMKNWNIEQDPEALQASEWPEPSSDKWQTKGASKGHFYALFNPKKRRKSYT